MDTHVGNECLCPLFRGRKCMDSTQADNKKVFPLWEGCPLFTECPLSGNYIIMCNHLPPSLPPSLTCLCVSRQWMELIPRGRPLHHWVFSPLLSHLCWSAAAREDISNCGTPTPVPISVYKPLAIQFEPRHLCQYRYYKPLAIYSSNPDTCANIGIINP